MNAHPDEFGGSDEGSHYMAQTSASKLRDPERPRKDQAPDPRTLPPVTPPPTRDGGREDAEPRVRRLG